MFKTFYLYIAILTLLAVCQGCSSKDKGESRQETENSELKTRASEPATEAEGQAPPIAISQYEETEILKQVNADNDAGAGSLHVIDGVEQIRTEYNMDTHTVIKVMRSTRNSDTSRAARLAMKRKMVEHLQASVTECERLHKGVSYRYEFYDKSNRAMYTFSISETDMSTHE